MNAFKNQLALAAALFGLAMLYEARDSSSSPDASIHIAETPSPAPTSPEAPTRRDRTRPGERTAAAVPAPSPLEVLARNGADYDARIEAADTLVATGDAKTLQALVQVLPELDAAGRLFAGRALCLMTGLQLRADESWQTLVALRYAPSAQARADEIARALSAGGAAATTVYTMLQQSETDRIALARSLWLCLERQHNVEVTTMVVDLLRQHGTLDCDESAHGLPHLVHLSEAASPELRLRARTALHELS